MVREQICKRLSGRDSKKNVVAYFKDYPGICLENEETQGEILGKKIEMRLAKQATHINSYSHIGKSRHLYGRCMLQGLNCGSEGTFPIYIQVVTGGTDQTSGECSLC